MAMQPTDGAVVQTTESVKRILKVVSIDVKSKSRNIIGGKLKVATDANCHLMLR